MKPKRPMNASGYLLVELLIGVAITLVVTGALLELAAAAGRALQREPEAADVQQRLRVAADLLYRDLVAAGAGTDRGPAPGPLARFLPPIQPSRRGAGDPELSHRGDAIALLHVPASAPQAPLAADLPSLDADLTVDVRQPGCPLGATPCAFSVGMRVLIFDTTGVGRGYDLFSIVSTTPLTLQRDAANRRLSTRYRSGTTFLAQADVRVYYLDAASRQLRVSDGWQSDLPLVDGVSALAFTYYADPDPHAVPRPAPGESSCLYDAADPPAPRLERLAGEHLVALSPRQLTDGPVCGLAPNRFDGDLLRIRKVGVSLGVRSPAADAEGEEYSVRFEVTPRNGDPLR